MPVSLMVSVSIGGAVIVNGLAPELKLMLFTSALAEKETPVVFETPKVPVSEAPLGTLAGVQLAAKPAEAR